MKLKIEITLNGNQLFVSWPDSHPIHALEMLDAAEKHIKRELLKKEQEPLIETTTAADLAHKMLSGGRKM